MSRHFYDSPSPTRWTLGIGAQVTIGVLILLLIGAGLWAFRVATSDVRGQGDATITKNSGANRIAAQEEFEDRYADIVATDAKLDVLAMAAKDHPDDKTVQQNLTGTQTYCLSAVAGYNAAARQFTSAEFRAVDLPAQIDTTDPTTDCKPSKEN